MPFVRVKRALVDKLLSQLAKFVELRNLRIRQFPRIIFLCGGQVGTDGPNPTSARGYFLRKIESSEPDLFKMIFLAEEINDWAEDMISHQYTPDLLTVESHVSGLASTVSLIVESPGSIAELGSFCLLPEVRAKLMVVIRDEWANTNSFITRGPIEYLKRNKTAVFGNGEAGPIYSYSWRLEWDCGSQAFLPNVGDLSQHSADFIADLFAFEASLPKRPKLDIESNGHISLLVADLIDTFSILRVREILHFLRLIKLKNISERDVNAHLFLLEKLQLITKKVSGSAQYYLSLDSNNFVEYNLKSAPTDIVDRTRFRTKILQHMKSGDRRRFRTLQSALNVER